MAPLHPIQECQHCLLPCPEPRAPRCSCLPSQRFPKLHTKAKTPSMHCHTSVSCRVPVTPRGTTDPVPAPAWTVGPQRGPGAHHTPLAVPSHPPARGPVSPMQVPLCPPRVPAVLAVRGGPSPCPHGCSNESPQLPAGLGVGSALTHPRWAPEGDRDTGTGSVKIKPLFHWLDPRL